MVSWCTASGNGLGQSGFEVVYSPRVPQVTAEEAFHMFCGCVLPCMALEHDLVRLHAPCLPDETQLDAWREYFRRLAIPARLEFAAVRTRGSAGPAAFGHFFLHVDGGGHPTPGDPRILNARVFWMRQDDAAAISLAPRRDILCSEGILLGGGWHPFEYYGGGTFRWFENEAELTVVAPAAGTVILEMMVEPGPGVGCRPFTLQVRDEGGSTLAQAEVRRRETVRLELQVRAPAACRPQLSGAGAQTALFFGGGVESLSLLSLLRHGTPYLLEILGPSWMNSDYGRNPIKRRLHDEMAARFGLTFLRAATSIRPLLTLDEADVSRYVTGSLFYTTALPFIRTLDLRNVFLAAEYEFALLEETFNQSIHPRFVHRIPKCGGTGVISALNGIPKIELLDWLYRRDPELSRYLYSCFWNSEKRWCGRCGKCRRMFAFCKEIGIPPEWVGMEDEIDVTPEYGYSTRGYWDNLEIYSKRRAWESACKKSAAR